MTMRKLLGAVIFILGCTFPAHAQGIDLAAGYALVRPQDLEVNFHGWTASLAGHVTPWFAVVGEGSGNHKTHDLFIGGGPKLSIHAGMVGPRFSGWRSRAVTPFIQVLVGAVHISSSAMGGSGSATKFGIQPGAGADMWVTPGLGIRIGADYRRVVANEMSNQARFHVGLVLASGR